MSPKPVESTREERAERTQTLVAWVVVAILAAFMLVMGFLLRTAIGDRGQTWQYRTSPLVPAQTYSSTRAASASTQAPKQVELPPPTVKREAQ